MTDTIEAPLELVIRGREDLPCGYACPKCGFLYPVGPESEPNHDNYKLFAATHCHPKACACGVLIDKKSGWTICDACRAKKDRESEAACFEKATKLQPEEYSEVLYWEGHNGDYGDGYFSDLDALLDRCEQEDIEMPLYVWCCKPHDFKLDAEHVLEGQVEQQNMFEDAFEHIKEEAILKMQVFFDSWNKEYPLRAWDQDRTRAVVLRPEVGADLG